MDRTSIQDFQNYHNPHTLPHAERPSAHDCPIESIEPYTDDDEAHSPSAPHSSDPDEAIFDHPSRPSSPATSRHSDDDNFSTLASESYNPSLSTDRRVPSPFTPLIKTRSPFRNPSSMRALQMETTPPPYLISPSSQQRYKFPSTPSRNGTPQSTRSVQRSPSKLSPAKKVKKEYPLVLLHVTLLPPAMPYSPAVMTSVLPPSILSNLKLLRQKSTPTVLARGILIPHPREDYDLLEERLLESLELTVPRILKCGHFHLDPDADADLIADLDDDADSDLDADICADCGRRVRDTRLGSGTGARRWDVRIYAANGLMRAGAWSAAWREMERVDVEISPWIDDERRRELERRREEEQEALGRGEDLARVEEREEEIPPECHEIEAGGKSIHTRMDAARRREIYGPDAQAFVDGLDPSPRRPANPVPSPPRARRSPRARTKPPSDIPLADVLKHYLLLAARDKRNIAIFVLAISILPLSLRAFTSTPPPTTRIPHLVPGPVAVSAVVGAGADAVAKATSAVVGVADAVSTATAAVGGAAQSAVEGAGGGLAAVRSGVEVVRGVLGVDVEGAGEMEME